MTGENLTASLNNITRADNVSLKTSFWLITIACLLLWNTPIGLTVLMPVNYVVTMIHELSHAITCLATGGHVSGLTIVSDGLGHGGLTYCSGGNPWLYTPAGYIGTTVVGCLLIFFSQFRILSRVLLFSLGLSVILAAVFFSTGSIFMPGMLFQALGSILAELIMGSMFILASLKLNDKMANLLILFLSVQIVLNSLTDLTVLFQISTSINQATFSDATNMAKISNIPPAIWSVIWATTSLAMLWLTLKISYLKSTPTRIKKNND